MKNDDCNLPLVIWERILDNLTMEDVIHCTNVNSFFRSKVSPTLKRLFLTDTTTRTSNPKNAIQVPSHKALRRFTGVEDVYVHTLIKNIKHVVQEKQAVTCNDHELQLVVTEELKTRHQTTPQKRRNGTCHGTSTIADPISDTYHIKKAVMNELVPALLAISSLRHIFVGEIRFYSDLRGAMTPTTTAMEIHLSQKQAQIRTSDGRNIEMKVYAKNTLGRNRKSRPKKKTITTMDHTAATHSCTITDPQHKHEVGGKVKKIIEFGGWPFASIKDSQSGIFDWRSWFLLATFFCHMCLLVGIVPLIL